MIHIGRLPNLSQAPVRVHKAIIRGLTVGVTRGTKFIQGGFPDQSLQQGFADYIMSLASILAAHHLGEDEMPFLAL